MHVKRIVHGNQPASTGGGGGPVTALVEWGPDFGGVDGDQFNVGVHVSMPSLALSHTKSVGAQLTMPSIGIAHTKSVGAHLSASALGAPFFQTATTAVTTGNTDTFTLTAPAGIQDGDLLLFLVGTTNVVATIASTPADTTLIRSDTNNNVNAHSYYKLASSESGDYTFTSSAACAWTGTCMLLRGVDQDTPINVSGGQSANATDPVAPTVTTTVVNCFIVAWAAQSEALPNTYTAPSGYAERADLNATNLTLTVGAQSANTKAQAAIGATGTATMDSSQLAGTIYAAQHIAIAPGPVVLAA